MNQETDTGNNQDHHRRERVKQKADVSMETSGGNPCKQLLLNDPNLRRKCFQLKEEF